MSEQEEYSKKQTKEEQAMTLLAEAWTTVTHQLKVQHAVKEAKSMAKIRQK